MVETVPKRTRIEGRRMFDPYSRVQWVQRSRVTRGVVLSLLLQSIRVKYSYSILLHVFHESSAGPIGRRNSVRAPENGSHESPLGPGVREGSLEGLMCRSPEDGEGPSGPSFGSTDIPVG